MHRAYTHLRVVDVRRFLFDKCALNPKPSFHFLLHYPFITCMDNPIITYPGLPCLQHPRPPLPLPSLKNKVAKLMMSHELLFKLLVSPLITPIVPYIIPYIMPLHGVQTMAHMSRIFHKNGRRPTDTSRFRRGGFRVKELRFRVQSLQLRV